MKGEGGEDCEFCDLATFADASVLLTTEHAYFASVDNDDQVLPGSGIICPRQHRETPFDLTDAEWLDIRDLLGRAKAALDERHRPDGYNLIWNVKPDGGQVAAHAHLHVIPRFHDEPLAGQGARWHLKQRANRRPDPAAPGLGRAGPAI